VALLERSADPNSYKRICTHFIQPSASATVERLGLEDAILAAGGKRNVLEIWTEWGWIKGSAKSTGYNIRRMKLDPLIRNLAISTPGVTFLGGCTAQSLIWRDGRVAGVEAAAPRDSPFAVSSRVVIGADGRASKIASWAGLKTVERPNNRFVYFTYYRGLRVSSTANSRYWYIDPNLVYAFENDDDTTLLGVFLPHDRHAEFTRDLEGAFLRLWESVADPPRVSEAERVCEMRGMLNMPNHRRVAAAPGVALVGDAALSLDPIWGTGCGFAMQSAEWLVDEITPVIADRRASAAALDRALARYRSVHLNRTRGHAWHIADFSRVRRARLFERLLFSAATRDRTTADVVLAYLAREDSLLDLAGPANIARALRVNTEWALRRRPKTTVDLESLSH
jgi:flavin-dependent dehydrogenase